jgi:hypothetical protein
VAVVIVSALLLGAARAPAAHAAADPAPAYDISWPQCGGPLPTGQTAFVIVGVNGGKAFTRNDCFGDQIAWARQFGGEPPVYINLNYTDGVSLTRTLVGPAGICRPKDESCNAYNFGYASARDAVGLAQAAGAKSTNWWLDIEEMNRWSPDTSLNARVIAGAIDYLKQQHFEVGIYSTPYQWNTIAGDFAPGLPNWTAGASNLKDAKSRCTPAFAFGGGRVEVVQYFAPFDTNWLCPNP